jgi:hypothetical protein
MNWLLVKPRPKRLWFGRLAWFSLLVPVVWVVVTFAGLKIASRIEYPNRAVAEIWLGWEFAVGFCLLIGSAVAGLVSFFGLLGSQWRLGWLVAVLGLVGSVAGGVVDGFLIFLNAMGHNC